MIVAINDINAMGSAYLRINPELSLEMLIPTTTPALIIGKPVFRLLMLAYEKFMPSYFHTGDLPTSIPM